MSEENGSLPELSTSQYVIQIEHQGVENGQYAIKDYALTQRVQDLKTRLKNYRGTIETLGEFPAINEGDEIDEDEPIDGSYWVGGVNANHSFINSDETSATLTFPALLLANKTNQEYSLLTVDGEMWIHKCANDQEGVHLWTNKWNDYYTKDEVDALLKALQNDYNKKIQDLNEWIESLSQEIASLKSQVQAIGAITGGSNPLSGNILILGDNSLFNTAISGEVNMAQRLADKLNLPANSGVVWLQNNNTDALYSYLQYSNESFGGIYLPTDDQKLTYSASIALRMTSNNAVILPFDEFSVVIYIANMGDIATLNSATDLNKSVNKITTNITWEDGETITYNERSYTEKIPMNIAFSASTPTAHAQAVVEFITPLISDGGVVYITTPITWNLNSQTALTSLQTSCRDALLVGLQAVANKNSLTYKSIYCIGELQRSNCLAADSKTVTSETAIDNYISNLCTMINEIKNNNVTFTPVNNSYNGAIAFGGDNLVVPAQQTIEGTVTPGTRPPTTQSETKIFSEMPTAGSATISAQIYQYPINTKISYSYSYTIKYSINNDTSTTNIITGSNIQNNNGRFGNTTISWNAHDKIKIICEVTSTGTNRTSTAEKMRVNYPWKVSIIT